MSAEGMNKELMGKGGRFRSQSAEYTGNYSHLLLKWKEKIEEFAVITGSLLHGTKNERIFRRCQHLLSKVSFGTWSS